MKYKALKKTIIIGAIFTTICTSISLLAASNKSYAANNADLKSEEIESYLDTKIITNKTYNVEGENKKVVQINIESGLNKSTDSIKQTVLTLNVPKDPLKIEVLDRGTTATNGKAERENDENTFKYEVENDKVKIQITNPEQEGKANYKEGEKDNVIVTLIYDEQQQIQNEEIKTTSSIDLYNHEETKVAETISKIEDEVDGIICYNIVNQSKLYKGSLYEGEEQTYKSSTQIDIRLKGVEKNIKVTEGKSYYQNSNGESITEANIVYKKTMISKEELQNILGDDGELIIKKVDGTEIRKINKETIEQQEGKIITIEYEENQEEIQIEINNAQNTGTINTINRKTIKDEKKSKEEIAEWTSIKTEGYLQDKKVYGEMQLQEPQTEAKLEINNSDLVSGITNKNVEIKATLITRDSKYDLYKNPKLEIEFPQEVESVDINKIRMIHAGELAKQKEEVYQNEEGKQILRLELIGEQYEHTNSDKISGAKIIINCNVKVSKLEQDEKSSLVMRYTNEKATQYTNENQEENFGKKEMELNYKVTKETESQEQIDKINVATENATQGKQTEDAITLTKTVDVGENSNIYETRVQKYTIKVKNNTDQEIKGITVKDKIPEELIYARLRTAFGTYNKFVDEENTKEFTGKIEELKPEEEKEISYYARTKQSEANREKKVGTKATAEIEGDSVKYESNLVENTIKESKFQIDMLTIVNANDSYKRDSVIGYVVRIRNITGEPLKNAVVTSKIPNGTQFESAEELKRKKYEVEENEFEYDDGSNEILNEEYGYYESEDESMKADYDKANQVVTWKLGTLKEGEERVIQLKLVFAETLKEEKYIEAQATIKADGTDEYTSNVEKVKQLPTPECTIVKTTNLPDKYVYEGQEFQYRLEIKNISNVSCEVNIVDEIPQGLILKKVEYEKQVDETGDSVDVYYTLEPGESITIIATVEANDLPEGTKELEIKNKAYVKEGEMDDVASNEVTNIILYNPDKDHYFYEDPDEDNNNEDNNGGNGNGNNEDENNGYGIESGENFDLRLDKTISSISVKDNLGTKEYNYDNANFVKIEIDRKTVNSTTVAIEYNINITNEGDTEGEVKSVVDYIPEGMQFNSNINNGWVEDEGQLINDELSGEIINPGETKTVNLILIKSLDEDNLGTVENTAEIFEDYNTLGMKDSDSTPGNNKNGEDDQSTATAIIGLRTGKAIIYIALTIAIVSVLAGGVYLIRKKVIKLK